MPSEKPASNQQLANAIRALSMDAVQKANSGHPGMPMGMADVATVLFKNFLKFNPKDPNWFDRDRFILSAGHGSMLLYSLLYLTGYEDIDIEQIKNFRQLGAKTCGHPEFGEAGGIETTTGPLGQGIANSVGFAFSEKLLEERYGKDIVDHYTYVIAGDGCLMEGISQEAISLAGHLKLSKLIVLFDDNGISIDGPTDLTTSEDHIKRFEACNWNTQSIDGHDFEQIEAAIQKAKESDKPSLIACKTTIAKGAPTKAGTSGSHGAPLGDEEISGARKILGWDSAPFEIPDEILSSWRAIGEKGSQHQQAWENNFNNLDSKKKAEFTRCVIDRKLPENIGEVFASTKQKFFDEKLTVASRAASGKVLDEITDNIPELIGGSADLTGSNLTKQKLEPISPDDFSGRYVYYGIREHAMASAMNGMVLHGGIRPFGGTFFVFTDYCRPAIRLSALMGLPVIYVMTHDSIGLGEDGPTHQPVEHLASLRAMPNVNVLRPCDALETAECWQIALQEKSTPTILVLSRQTLPFLSPLSEENNCEKGAYAIKEVNNPDLILLGTGSEVSLCINAAKQLEKQGRKVRVVSIPSFEKFDSQSEEYKTSILGDDSTPKIAVEAAIKFGWEKYIGRNGKFIGMDSFGASAPAPELYKHFGITEENIISSANELLSKKSKAA